MNILEAIAMARDEDMVINRAGWPEGKELFWKDGAIHINNPEKDRYEERLHYFLPESVLATDWEAR